MNGRHLRPILDGIAATILACTFSVPAFAANGGPVPEFNTVNTGTVQAIDYLHHAITINGHTYAVTEGARFSGIAGFSVLHIGMPISFVLGKNSAIPAAPQPTTTTTDDNSPPVVTAITWLPGGA